MQAYEPAVDAKGIPTGELVLRDSPMESRKDERMFWASLVPVMATKHAQMEPTWKVLDEIVRVRGALLREREAPVRKIGGRDRWPRSIISDHLYHAKNVMIASHVAGDAKS